METNRPTCHLDPTLRIEPHSPTVLDPHCPTWCPTHRSWIDCGVASADSGTNTNLRDGRAGTTNLESDACNKNAKTIVVASREIMFFFCEFPVLYLSIFFKVKNDEDP